MNAVSAVRDAMACLSGPIRKVASATAESPWPKVLGRGLLAGGWAPQNAAVAARGF